MLPAPPKFSRFLMVKILLCIFCATRLVTAAPVEPSRTGRSGALTNWQAALRSFQKIGTHIGDNNFDQARTELNAASTHLAPPYDTMAATFATRLASVLATSPDLKNPARLKATIELCADLRAYDVALRLQSATSNAEDLADDPTYAWRLFESGNIKAALTEYRRKLAEETIENLADYYREQIRLVEQRANNLTNVQFSLEFVRGHYLKTYEEKADSLSAIQELNRVLPFARDAAQSVKVVEAIINRLSNLGDENGREAWEDKLLLDFKTLPQACANVHLERGLRAFAQRDFSKTLTLLRRVCAEFPDTLAWGDAQYTVALVLQQQQKFDEAMAEYQKIFPSKVRDHDLDPEKSEDCKNYRHRAAIGISECFAAKKDFAQALSYAEQARDKYKFDSFCKNCLKENKESMEIRINALRDAVAKTAPK